MGWSSSFSHSLGSIAGGAIGGIFGGAGGAAIGSQIGSMFGPSQERQDRRNYQYELRNAISAWNMQNDYNSPVQQMARLREAGLNPRLVYGSGNVTGNSSTSLSLPSLGSSDVMSGANAFNNLTSDLSTNSFKQSMQEQRIAAKQSLVNNELDLQLKQAQLEYLRLRNAGMTTGKGNVKTPVEKSLTFSQQQQVNKILAEINSDGKLDMTKESNRINPGAYLFNWAVDHIGKHYANMVWDIHNSYNKALDKYTKSGEYMLP